MRVIGIDPGIGITGFSIIDHSRLETSLIAYGAIRPPKKQGLEKRLFYLFNEMNKLNDLFYKNTDLQEKLKNDNFNIENEFK